MKFVALAINMMAVSLVHAMDGQTGCKWYKESCAVDSDCCGLDIVNMVSYCQEGACEAVSAAKSSSSVTNDDVNCNGQENNCGGDGTKCPNTYMCVWKKDHCECTPPFAFEI